jgi:Ferritin-like domain
MAAADPGCPARGSGTPTPGPSSRGLFFRRALAGGAVLAGGVLAGSLPRLAASAPSPAQDAEIFNFALLLEYMQARFYDEAARSGVLDGGLADFVEVVRAHEQAHVEYLTDALGDAARAEPAFSFEEFLQDAESVAAAAVALEDLGVAAYNGQATNLTPRGLAAAATIVSVDARHAAWIRSIIGETPAEEPTDVPLTRRQVEVRIRDLGFLEGS